MDDRQQPSDDLGRLAAEEMAEKRAEMGNDAQARELYDVPTQSASDLAEEQRQDEQP